MLDCLLNKYIQNRVNYIEYKISGPSLWLKLQGKGLRTPMGILDANYYYTDRVGWANVLYNLVFSSLLYQTDRFDCENYALKSMIVCHEKYGLNAYGMTIGDIPLGRHGFNVFYCGEDDFMIFEPNAGFGFAGAFEIGDNEYKPDMVLI